LAPQVFHTALDLLIAWLVGGSVSELPTMANKPARPGLSSAAF
jgi:hypothetical protein